MASKQPTHLQAVHGWSGPEGTFEAGELVPKPDAKPISEARVDELIKGGYVERISAKEAEQVAAAAETDLPGQ
ncbi:MAG: hypothetical protein PGN26_14585 [Xylophilus ampelinus]